MKSYLSLIPISAKVHRRQSRMTRLCIVFAVFLVTAICSMAEMGLRMERSRLMEKHGELSLGELLTSEMGQTFFIAAAVLFGLVLLAGVLMISSSLNSNVAQRTQFFGMLRCLGMSRQQIVRFVRLEALNWCRTAIPAGLLLGLAASWILCLALRFLVGEEFAEIPLFGVSILGLASGVAVGLITVLLAARAPARRASRVEPITAVSGNSQENKARTRAVHPGFLGLETALGIHHAAAGRKNLLLMTGSVALSIVLFLCFSVLIDFVGYLMPQSSSAPDLEIFGREEGALVEQEMAETIAAMPGMKRVYGRRSCLDIPAQADFTMASAQVDLISYEDFELECLEKDGELQKGSDLKKVYGDSRYVLAVWDPDCAWEIGDQLQAGGETLEIAGLLKRNPFDGDGLTHGELTLIISGETFFRLTGIGEYSLLLVQTSSDVTEEEVEAIRRTAEGYEVRDRREEGTAGTYLAFVLCVYGFLAVIALVTVLNLVNSMALSVSARIRQYGVMRAVGMEAGQLAKMILVEAFTYVLSGCGAGCLIGLGLSRELFELLIAGHFLYARYRLPAGPLAVILLFVVCTALISVWAPIRRIRRISVTELIGEL